MIGLPDVYLETSAQVQGALFRTAGEHSNPNKISEIAVRRDNHVNSMLGQSRNTQDYHSGYALTVAWVVIRHMTEVWGFTVEDWDIS